MIEAATPEALAASTEAEQSPMEFVVRHLQGDWGECNEHDWQANEDALSMRRNFAFDWVSKRRRRPEHFATQRHR